jgi:hypothetical protein
MQLSSSRLHDFPPGLFIEALDLAYQSMQKKTQWHADADAGAFEENVVKSETSDGNPTVERGATD